jgi:hypothetical protein
MSASQSAMECQTGSKLVEMSCLLPGVRFAVRHRQPDSSLIRTPIPTS